jgi:ABC-2 type transport system permease protein
MDMTGGIIARFRTMAIARVAVLTGHVLGSMIQSLLGIALVIGVAAAVGYRTSAGLLAWLAAIGLLVLITFAITWLSVALGLVSGSPETASNLPMFLMLLPFLGSGFVPTTTMPAGLRWFAEYQPFTPMIQTVRGLLTGGPIGDNAIMAVAWGAGIAALSYLWARRLYQRPMQAR